MSKKLTNKNRLSVIFPEIVKEWDYERNYPLTPHDVSYGCHKKVFWRCKKGHTWSVNVNARTNPNKRGTKNKKRTKKVNGCPYCSGRYVTKETCLAAVNPKLIREWHPTKNGKLTPYDVMPSSCEKVWWVCENKNHTWRSSISSRSAGAGCPYCSGHRMVKEKSLAAMRPELIKEWHPTKNGKLTPYNTSYGSRSAVFWKCIKRGHIWSASVKTRSRGHGCPYCSAHLFAKENCLAIKDPKLALEWHPTKNDKLTPNDITCNSYRKVWWLCKNKKHEWEATVSIRSRGGGCPYCYGRRVTEETSLAVVNPKLAKEWHPSKNGALTPHDVSRGSAKKVFWKCANKGHVWFAAIKMRSRGDGCPFCRCYRIKGSRVFLRSMVEVYFYLKLKKKYKIVRVDKQYPKRYKKHHRLANRRRYDFYIPETNTYIEVTGYTRKHSRSNVAKTIYASHTKKIREKRHYVKNILKANFKFIRKILTGKERTALFEFIV